MGRPTLYSKEVEDRIISTLEKTGCVKLAYESVKIGKRTYYEWVKRYPHLAHRIAKAQETFRMENIPAEVIEKTRERLFKLGTDGVVETYTKRGANFDADGKVISRFVSEMTVQRPTPEYALNRILGPVEPEKAWPVIQALEVLMKEGVASGEQAEIISDGIAEMQDRLRSLYSAQQQALSEKLERSLEASAEPTDSSDPPSAETEEDERLEEMQRRLDDLKNQNILLQRQLAAMQNRPKG